MEKTCFDEMDYEINPESALLDILERTMLVTEQYLHTTFPELKDPSRSNTSSFYQEQIICASDMITRMQALEESIRIYRQSLINFLCPEPPKEVDDEAGDDEIPF